MTDRTPTSDPVAEPTEAGDRLLTDIIQDHSGIAYFVIEMVRSAIPDIEAEARQQARAAFAARVAALPTWDKRSVPGGLHVNRAAVLRALAASPEPAETDR